MNPKLVILFDLDGTLTYGVSTTRFIFRQMGAEDYFRRLEEDWLREQTDHPTLAKMVTKRMKGWRLVDIHRALSQIPKMRGIGETMWELKKRGYLLALSTLGYELSARYFQDRYGFDEVRGTTLEIKEGLVTGRGMKIFEENEKALFLKAMASPPWDFPETHHRPGGQPVGPGGFQGGGHADHREPRPIPPRPGGLGTDRPGFKAHPGASMNIRTPSKTSKQRQFIPPSRKVRQERQKINKI